MQVATICRLCEKTNILVHAPNDTQSAQDLYTQFLFPLRRDTNVNVFFFVPW